MDFKKIRQEIELLEKTCRDVAIKKHPKYKESDFIGILLEFKDYIGVEFKCEGNFCVYSQSEGYKTILISFDEISNHESI